MPIFVVERQFAEKFDPDEASLQFIDQSPGFTGALIPEAEAFLVPYI